MFFKLPETNEELLAQCEVQSFRSSGSGGQHINVTDSAVRIIHQPTGLRVVSQTERSQLLNKRECLRKLREKIEKLNYKAPRRIPTKVPFSEKTKKLENKSRHSEKKKLRSKITQD